MIMRMSFCAIVALVLAAPNSGRGDVVYNYTGNAFTDAVGGFTTEDYVSASVTFDTTPSPNSTLDISNVVSFRISAGPLTFDNTMPDVFIFAGDFDFDASSRLASWRFDVIRDTVLDVGTYSYPDLDVLDFGIDLVVLEHGQVSNAPGQWRAVPEPSAVALFALGFLGAAGLGWHNRRRDGRPASATS